MRKNGRINFKENKRISRLKYAERQIETFVKWSFNKRNCVKFKDIKNLHEKFNIKCYG